MSDFHQMRPLTSYVVLAHTAPDRVHRLVDRLRPYPTYLHVDAGTSRGVADEILGVVGEDVHPLPRYRTGWGSWGLMEATLEGLRQASGAGASHVVVLSGTDYPLRSADRVNAYLQRQPTTSWVRHARIPVPWLGGDGGESRVSQWNRRVFGRRLRLPVQRRPPEGLDLYYGQAQCALSGRLAAWIVSRFDQDAGVARFFRRTWIPDELLLPSLAMASPFRDEVRDDNLWFSRWSGGPHPENLGLVDLHDLEVASEEGGEQGGWGPVKLFARKFAADGPTDILDCLDRERLGYQPA
jgi:Core-2/I-Branching enzyme